MQLDSTRIAIRERDLLDICDLSLQVIRTFALPLAAALLAGALPLALLNWWLIGSLSDVDYHSEWPWGYMFTLVMLVLWELPFATAFITLFLGQVMFEQPTTAGRLLRDFVRSLPQMVLYQGIVRGVLIWTVVLGIVPYTFWPYLNEIILLERNPLRPPGRGGMSTWGRSAALHGGSGGELFGRWLGSVAISTGLLLSFWATLWYLVSLFTKHSEIGRLAFTLYLPTALWLTVGYCAVVRFLCYLDLRIRREGWEVELQMRAEAARLTRHIA